MSSCGLAFSISPYLLIPLKQSVLREDGFLSVRPGGSWVLGWPHPRRNADRLLLVLWRIPAARPTVCAEHDAVAEGRCVAHRQRHLEAVHSQVLCFCLLLIALDGIPVTSGCLPLQAHSSELLDLLACSLERDLVDLVCPDPELPVRSQLDDELCSFVASNGYWCPVSSHQ